MGEETLKACVFPGQGSQFVGMGEGLFARYPEMTALADEILGCSVEELCLKDPRRRLHQTQYTQPALYVVNALTYRRRCDSGAPPPAFLAGHSLGEYNALLAAEVFDFAAGLRLVKARGELMSAVSGGGMAAVLGCDGERVEEILRARALLTLDVANYNTPSQLVLSGPAEDIARAEDIFLEIGAKYILLKVSAAFHSRYMEPFVQPLRAALREVEFHPPKIPVLSNVSARPHEAGQIREHLERQIRQPVRWTESVRYLLDAGVEDFEEVGPGGVLTKMIKAIRETSVPPAARKAAAVTAAPGGRLAVTPERLGAASFRRDYKVRRAYAAGAMYKGIASQELVVRMGKAGYIGFFGAGGVKLATLEESILAIQRSLGRGEPFGVNLLSTPNDLETEMAVVELCLRHDVRFAEAAGYVTLSPALVRYRLKSLRRDGQGRPVSIRKLIAKVSRPEVAAAFLNPPPEPMVAELLRRNLVSGEEAELARLMPMADDLCVEADSAGHTDMGVTAVLLPTMLRQRDEVCRQREYAVQVRVGSSGGIGIPEAAAAAFLLGADFIVTGSINQCTVEAGISDDVKDLLQTIGVQDTEYAPAGDMFELGARVQVLKKGVFFPARANKLHDLWRHHGSWDEIDAPARARIERDYFGRSFEQVYEETQSYYSGKSPQEIERAERDPRHKMALVFRWYFVHTMRLALAGVKDQRVNYQVHCGPALGAFNQWVKGTELEPWRNRHVDILADRIMEGAAQVLDRQLQRFAGAVEPE
jgi:trans-AT polyketide synthase/acyltransferase/oxidoreductase domain-containing protein